jgi:hypothetical protein
MQDIDEKQRFLRSEERREKLKAVAVSVLFVLVVAVLIVLQHKPTAEDRSTPTPLEATGSR